MKGTEKMKKKMICLLFILLVFSLTVCACGVDDSPAGIVKKQLTSGPWSVDMSEGTTAVYTFTAKGEFTCDATMTVGEQSASLTRSGTYEIKEVEGFVTVFLMYPDVTYLVEIDCTEGENGYDFVIAGCPMYQK